MSWVALLRAVNVGGRNRVPMAPLRELCADLGFASVATYVASGNVVFAAPGQRRDALTRRIETAIAGRFGVATRVVLRSADELARVVAAHPFGADPSKTFVTFLAAEPSAAAAASLAALDVPEETKLVGSDLYVRYPNGVGRATLTGAAIERRLGVPGTARNWRTVTKLAELAAAVQL